LFPSIFACSLFLRFSRRFAIIRIHASWRRVVFAFAVAAIGGQGGVGNELVYTSWIGRFAFFLLFAFPAGTYCTAGCKNLSNATLLGAFVLENTTELVNGF
jgi:hypothetical protein